MNKTPSPIKAYARFKPLTTKESDICINSLIKHTNTQILIDNKEILNKISASNEEKLALLNLYKFIINTYKTNSRINIFSDYESILAGTKQL